MHTVHALHHTNAAQRIADRDLTRNGQRLAAQARLYASRDLALPTDLAAALLQEGLNPDTFQQIEMDI